MTVRALTQSVISTQDGVRITIHTVPNAKETAIILEPDGNIMMRVHAHPVKGKANREIIKWLSKKLRRPSSRIRIVAGAYSNLKTLEIVGMDGKSFLEAIGQKTAVSS
ncbi:MAG: DUF167 domain-containing protein [Candidatus Bathyarchaeia archaeon]